MPMYEYKCSACENEFEELVFGSIESVPCPKCGSSNTRRLVSAGCVRSGNAGLGSSLGGGMGAMPSAGGCGSGGFS